MDTKTLVLLAYGLISTDAAWWSNDDVEKIVEAWLNLIEVISPESLTPVGVLNFFKLVYAIRNGSIIFKNNKFYPAYPNALTKYDLQMFIN